MPVRTVGSASVPTLPHPVPSASMPPCLLAVCPSERTPPSVQLRDPRNGLGVQFLIRFRLFAFAKKTVFLSVPTRAGRSLRCSPTGPDLVTPANRPPPPAEPARVPPALAPYGIARGPQSPCVPLKLKRKAPPLFWLGAPFFFVDNYPTYPVWTFSTRFPGDK